MLALLIAPLPAVTVETGTLPVVISAPHGGRQRLPDVPDRTGKDLPKGAMFATVTDTGTAELARAAADAIAARLGARPCLVVSNTSRKQFDANRPERNGVEHEAARPAYREFHDALARFRGEILKRHGKGLLLDLHGQGATAGAVYRGTANGATVSTLRRTALVGPTGLLGRLEASGVRIIPACADEGAKEDPRYDGGWIVRHYGPSRDGVQKEPSAKPDRFWAVQLEFGINFRRKDGREKTAAALADAVASFARAELGVP